MEGVLNWREHCTQYVLACHDTCLGMDMRAVLQDSLSQAVCALVTSGACCCCAQLWILQKSKMCDYNPVQQKKKRFERIINVCVAVPGFEPCSVSAGSGCLPTSCLTNHRFYALVCLYNNICSTSTFRDMIKLWFKILHVHMYID